MWWNPGSSDEFQVTPGAGRMLLSVCAELIGSGGLGIESRFVHVCDFEFGTCVHKSLPESICGIFMTCTTRDSEEVGYVIALGYEEINAAWIPETTCMPVSKRRGHVYEANDMVAGDGLLYRWRTRRVTRA